MDDEFLPKLVQDLAREVRNNTVTLATLTADLSNISKDVAILSKLLTEGNGSAPMISRLAILENSADGLEDVVDDIIASISCIEMKAKGSEKKLQMAMESKKLSLEDTKDKRRSLVAIITSVIALVTTVMLSIFGITGP